MSTALYHQLLLEEAHHPRHQGSLDQPDATAQTTNASCGDSVTVELRFSTDKSQIEQMAWRGAGCIISQAFLSLLSDWVQGKTIQQVLALTKEEMLNWIDKSELSPGREKCLTLGLRAVHAAVRQAE